MSHGCTRFPLKQLNQYRHISCRSCMRHGQTNVVDREFVAACVLAAGSAKEGKRAGRRCEPHRGLGRGTSDMAIGSHLAFRGMSSKGRVAFAMVVRPASGAPVRNAISPTPPHGALLL